MKKNRVCSLFSGIGGFETGMKERNIDIVFSSEINKFSSRAYELIYGEKPNGDIIETPTEDIPDHDILTAGFPCQSFSIAGKRLGLEDTRGTLFFEVARVLRDKKPKGFMLENVVGLLSDNNGTTFKQMIYILSEIGYYIDFDILNAKHFDLPQNRERIIIVGVSKGLIGESCEIGFSKSPYPQIVKLKKEFSQESVEGLNILDLERTNTNKRIIDIFEENVESKYYMKEEVSQSIIQKAIEEKESIIDNINLDTQDIDNLFNIPKEIINDNERQRRLYNPNGISPTILGRSDSPKIMVYGLLEMKAGKQIRSVYNPNGLSPTVDTAQGGHRQIKVILQEDLKVRKLTPLECFRLQGFPDEYYFLLKENKYSDTQLYKIAGNAVPPPLIEAVYHNLIKYIN